MSTKHTPGPWYFEIPDEELVHPCNGLITDAPISKKPAGVMALVHVHKPADFANAHLIAAAPDLLEACKECLEFMICRDIKNKVISGLSLQLRAAIVKAEGKQGIDNDNQK